MAAEIIILDTGPLVAYLLRRDTYHLWSVAALKKLSGVIVTCEAVVSEAFYLLSRERNGILVLVQLLRAGFLRVLPMTGELDRILELTEKYSDVPMSYADACLVRIAETHPRARIISLDSDFKTYRMNKNARIPLVCPD